jgi:hypothetical protein
MVTANSMSAQNTAATLISVVVGGTDIPLPDNQSLDSFIANGTSTAFIVPATGDYLITYSMSVTVAALVSSRVLLDGTPIPASIVAPTVAASEFETSFIVSLASGDTLSLQLFSVITSVTLLGGASTFMTVVRLT